MDNDEHDIAPARIRSTGTTMPQVSPQVAAILLALPGMVLFGVYHWFWVAPVAAVFLEGIIWVLLFGTVVGWAYQRTMLDVGRTGIAWASVLAR